MNEDQNWETAVYILGRGSCSLSWAPISILSSTPSKLQRITESLAKKEGGRESGLGQTLLSSQLLFLDDCRRGLAQWLKGLCNFFWGSVLVLVELLVFFSGIEYFWCSQNLEKIWKKIQTLLVLTPENSQKFLKNPEISWKVLKNLEKISGFKISGFQDPILWCILESHIGLARWLDF